ncbi:uncharacterized protein LOC129828553 [Salvelinus fontinalis]|uniref:uncharacterized protein LOC129828553 n=1 Tax=Salvelinus fontinalis TaxID=8038 RepID=UPI0024854E0C|nr:uncharacterized protein LOC129828553 [Salvelinus fontinalis]
MASGIAVHDDVVHTFDKIRVRLQGADKQEQLKLVLFKISDDGKCIIVDEDKCLKVKDLNGEEDVFRKIVNMMPTEDCRYALYDCSWESKDSPKEALCPVRLLLGEQGQPQRGAMPCTTAPGRARTAPKRRYALYDCSWESKDSPKEALCPVRLLLGEQGQPQRGAMPCTTAPGRARTAPKRRYALYDCSWESKDSPKEALCPVRLLLGEQGQPQRGAMPCTTVPGRARTAPKRRYALYDCSWESKDSPKEALCPVRLFLGEQGQPQRGAMPCTTVPGRARTAPKRTWSSSCGPQNTQLSKRK